MVGRLLGMTALILFAFTARSARAADEAPADPAGPRGTVAAFFKAIEGGDGAAARAMVMGSEKQMAVLDAMVPVMSGFKALETAAVKKWGDDGKKIAQGEGGGPGPNLDIAKKLDGAKEQIADDVATVTPVADSAGKEESPIKLKKVDGKWKIDLSGLPTDGMESPAALNMLKAMGDAAKKTAGEIEAGKYATVDAAKDALRQQILPILKSTKDAQRSATQPGAAPPTSTPPTTTPPTPTPPPTATPPNIARPTIAPPTIAPPTPPSAKDQPK